MLPASAALPYRDPLPAVGSLITTKHSTTPHLIINFNYEVDYETYYVFKSKAVNTFGVVNTFYFYSNQYTVLNGNT